MVDLHRFRGTSGEKNFIKRIKAPVSLEAVLTTEIMQKPLSNLEKKDNPRALKDDFSSRADLPIFTSVALVLLVKQNNLTFSNIKNKKTHTAPL